MKNPFPGTVRHHLGDAEFTLLKPAAESTGDSPKSSGALHCHRYFEVHCNTGTARSLTLPTGQIRLEPGQLLLICPGCMHYSVPYHDSYRVLSFELQQSKGEEGFYRHFSGLLNTLHLKPLPATRKLKTFLDEFTALNPGNTVMGFCQSKLVGLNLLVALLENLSTFAGVCGDAAYIPEHTEAFDAALDMMIYGNTTLQQIAETLGYSPRHTARLIHSRYGASLSQIRKQLAQQTARHTEDTL